jgi:hypothetical protein
LLLTAGVMAVAALWLLARIRFPERPVTPNPVPSVLSQLATGPKFDDLAGEIAQLQARLQPSLLAFNALGSLPISVRTTAIRLRDDLAVTVVPFDAKRELGKEATILVRDRASGLAVVRVPVPIATSRPVPWTPRQPQQSRYLVTSELTSAGVSLRPVFVGSLDPVDTPLWSEQVWAVPGSPELALGSFVFTSGGELAGLVTAHGGGLAIVPGTVILTEAERLLAMPPGPAGVIGIEVQELTASVASVTGAAMGVVVTWVDADGPGSEQLMAGDVIEAIDGRTLASRQHWDVRMARLTVGETLTLRVRHRGETREVGLVANAPAAKPPSRSLGLTLRARPKIGAEVVSIEPGSAADRAGLLVGDVITLVVDVSAPTPAQVLRSFTATDPGEGVLVAATRGDAHFVTTLER